MRELLYYPNFFIEDEGWVKFALLYLGRVITIVPTEANRHLSDAHNLILNETDLLNSHSPTEEEINSASLKMGNELGFLINNPINDFILNRRTSKFNEWQDERTFTYELFEGKFPVELKRMLTSKRFASESENGILVHNNIANIYMSILAHTIAEDRGISTITDVKEKINFVSIEQAIKRHQTYPNRYKTLTDSINITLPRSIHEIELSEIIEFRNHPRNKKNLQEFQIAIENLRLLVDENLSEYKMIDLKKELFDAKKQYISEIIAQFGAGTGATIGIYQLINGDAQHLDFLGEVLGLGAIQGMKKIYGNINEYNNIRKATSYISDIENLSRGGWNRRHLRR